MKRFSQLFLATVLMASFGIYTACGQDKSKRPSPPVNISKDVSGVTVTVDYSSPAVKGRKVWGGLEPYDKVWRTGANEATTFEVSADVTINGEKLPKGKYALFTIPTEGNWTVIFNKVANQWGAYEYNEAEDALRITVTPKMAEELTENLAFDIGDDGTVSFAWEYLTFNFKVASAGS